MKLIFLIISLCVASMLKAQPKLIANKGKGIGNNPVYGWRKLTWDDFRGRQTNTNAVALTNSGGVFKWECDNNKCTVTGIVVFYPDSSFAITRDPYILIHEQGHFDIAEIFVRLFNKRIKSYQGCSEEKAEEIPIIAGHFGDMREAMQKQYDKETKCALDHIAQERWNVWIKEQLNKQQ